MTKRTWLVLGSLLLMLISPGVALADPVLFTTTGHIRIGDGPLETFEGSFWLSDPVVEWYAGDDSRGDELDRFTVSGFTLTSASYTLSGSGTLAVWWALYRDSSGFFLNDLDSVMVLTTSIGLVQTPSLVFASEWFGTPGAQPVGFSGMPAEISGTRSGRILDMTAVRARVPEPSTLLFLGAGLTALALRHRKRG